MTKINVVRSYFHKLEGQAISWAGECPWTGALCFGTESGNFFAPREDDIEAVLVADDAINGAAFSGTLAAFTSRESLYVGRQRHSGHIELTDTTPWSIGAHGVAASRHGAFFVPVGPKGLLAIRAKVNGQGFETRTIQGADQSWYAYQLIRVGEAGSGEVFAFAARANGVFVFTYYGGWDLSPISNHFFRDRDIISVSPMNHPAFPLGIIALSRSGEIMAIPDATSKGNSAGVRYGAIQGSPYTACAAKGHILVLTSKELIAIPNVVEQLATGTIKFHQDQSWVLPVEASDLLYEGGDRVTLISEGAADDLRIADLVNPGSTSLETRKEPVLEREYRVVRRDTLAAPVDAEWQASESGLVLAGV